MVEKDEIGKGYEFAKDQYVLLHRPKRSRRSRRRRPTRSTSSSSCRSPRSTGVPREGLLPRPRQGRRARVPAAGRGAGGHRPRGAGPVFRAGQAVPGAAPSAGRRAGDGAAPLRRRAASADRSAASRRARSRTAELALAKQLIEQTANDEFEPEKYQDTVRERVLEAIQRKVEGQEITAEPSEAPRTKIIDLMDALKASLAKRGSSTEAKKPASESEPRPTKLMPRPGRKGKRARVGSLKTHVGTSGWSYKEWKGSFYPAKFPAEDMLPLLRHPPCHRRNQ